MKTKTPLVILLLFTTAMSCSQAPIKNSPTNTPNRQKIITEQVGIGTTSFTDGEDVYKLSVNGNVRAHTVKVYTDWADYVFESNYKLQTLEEVEQHINEKGHLKDIPSAKEVGKNGIELGEMNKLLLQKIEELTLYLIDQNKEISKLKNEVQQLKDKKQ